jgi:hypothetical protein
VAQFGLNTQPGREHGRRELMNAKANLHEQFGRFDHYWNLSSWPASTTGDATEMLMADWTGQLARERMAELHRQAERQRLVRLARVQRRGGTGGVGRGRRWLAGWLKGSGAGPMVEPSTAPSTARTSAMP